MDQAYRLIDLSSVTEESIVLRVIGRHDEKVSNCSHSQRLNKISSGHFSLDKETMILPPMDMRPAHTSDFPAIAAIYNWYLGRSTMDTEIRDSAYFQKMSEDMSSREALYVVTVHKQIVGFGAIKKYTYKMGYQYACETSVFMARDHRGKGYGTPFKKFIMAECKRLQYKHLVARIFKSNRVSIDYNLKLGYTIVGVQQKIGYVNDQWEDVVIMQYLVEE